MNYKILLIIFELSMTVLFSQCDGCSKSGRKNLAQQHKEEVAHKEEKKSKEDNNITVPQLTDKKSSEANNLTSLYKKCKKSVFLIYTSINDKNFQGSGFFINSNGVGISNYHVFEDTYQGKEKIYLSDQKTYKVKKVIRKSKKLDYIIFQVDIPTATPFLEIANSTPAIGQEVFTIGNPRGLKQTLSKGIVSGYRENNKLIQTTTEITHGSSGGPLMNMKGQVVGITTSGVGEANLNFAINIKLLELSR